MCIRDRVSGSSTSQNTASVLWAKNGSITADAQSGISFMSDSLMAFQPAIDEPSNITPSAKASSSMRPESIVTCCIFPRGSVKRRSTNLISSSLTFLATLFGSAMLLPCHALLRRPSDAAADGYSSDSLLNVWLGSQLSDGVIPGLARTNAHGFLHVRHEDLSVSNAACFSRGDDSVDGLLDHVVVQHQLEFHLRQEIDDILGTAIKLGMPLLPAEPFGLGHSNTLESDFLQGFFHFIQLEGLDDRFDLFHS